MKFSYKVKFDFCKGDVNYVLGYIKSVIYCKKYLC